MSTMYTDLTPFMALPLPSKSLPPKVDGRCDELKIDLGSLELYSNSVMETATHQGYCSGITTARSVRFAPVCGTTLWNRPPLYIILRTHIEFFAQFDYLKNTVSVYNDYYQAFKDYKVTAEVYGPEQQKGMGQKPEDRYPGRRCRKRYLHNRFPQNASRRSIS